jgi:hypothetical protein
LNKYLIISTDFSLGHAWKKSYYWKKYSDSVSKVKSIYTYLHVNA